MVWRSLAIFSTTLILSGCGTPLVPMSLYAVSGLSYVTSGKGVTGHAISAATHRDCALLNIAQTGGVCRADPASRQQPALAMVGGRAATAEEQQALLRLIDQSDGWRDGEREAVSPNPADVAPATAPISRDSVPFN